MTSSTSTKFVRLRRSCAAAFSAAALISGSTRNVTVAVLIFGRPRGMAGRSIRVPQVKLIMAANVLQFSVHEKPPQWGRCRSSKIISQSRTTEGCGHRPARLGRALVLCVELPLAAPRFGFHRWSLWPYCVPCLCAALASKVLNRLRIASLAYRTRVIRAGNHSRHVTVPGCSEAGVPSSLRARCANSN